MISFIYDIEFYDKFSGDSAGLDMAVLTLCNHLVLSRGTFGLWSSILSGASRILPKHFYHRTMKGRPFEQRNQVPIFDLSHRSVHLYWVIRTYKSILYFKMDGWRNQSQFKTRMFWMFRKASYKYFIYKGEQHHTSINSKNKSCLKMKQDFWFWLLFLSQTRWKNQIQGLFYWEQESNPTWTNVWLCFLT